MFMEERQREISELLQNQGKITVAEITEKYGISDESARRDLRLLEQQGLCQRTHGGAILPRQVNILPPPNRDFSRMTIYENYREIARIAAARIRENDTVYLTSGSLGYIMLSLLPREFPFTLVVNSVELGKELRAFDNVDVYIAGGKMRPSGSLVDSLAAGFVRQLHFDLCFLTGAGLTAEFGLSNGTDEAATFQRTVLKNSRRRILLMPGGKIGVDSFIKVCEADVFHTIVTDWECGRDALAPFAEMGIETVCAKEP